MNLLENELCLHTDRVNMSNMDAKKKGRLDHMYSLSEEDIIEKYEKTPSAPIPEMDVTNISENSPVKQNGYNENVRMMEQSRHLLDFREPYRDGLKMRRGNTKEAGALVHHDSDDDSDSDTDKTVNPHFDDDDYQRPAKLDLIVGFLRLFNFISCCTSVFAVILSFLFSISEPSQDLVTPVNLTTVYNIWSPIQEVNMDSVKSIQYREDDELLFALKIIASLVILVYLLITAVFVIIDSVATVTFRWKEYGELSFRHTDATSILFLVSKSRWKLRLLTCLTVASAASLQTTQVSS